MNIIIYKMLILHLKILFRKLYWLVLNYKKFELVLVFFAVVYCYETTKWTNIPITSQPKMFWSKFVFKLT